MSLFWLYKLHFSWSEIFEVLSLYKSRVAEVPVIGMKNVYSVRLSNAETFKLEVKDMSFWNAVFVLLFH